MISRLNERIALKFSYTVAACDSEGEGRGAEGRQGGRNVCELEGLGPEPGRPDPTEGGPATLGPSCSHQEMN